jgi:hypothetical protein
MTSKDFIAKLKQRSPENAMVYFDALENGLLPVSNHVIILTSKKLRLLGRESKASAVVLSCQVSAHEKVTVGGLIELMRIHPADAGIYFDDHKGGLIEVNAGKISSGKLVLSD